MSYIGGKARGSQHILAVLNHPHFDGYDYVEPFVGMGHVLRRVTNKRSYTNCRVTRMHPSASHFYRHMHQRDRHRSTSSAYAALVPRG